MRVAKGLERAAGEAQVKIMEHMKAAGTEENGWMFATKTGLYGTDYVQRALITAIGLGANRPQDAVYPTSETDGTGKPYNGAKKYVMHFDKGQTPPVNAFWSIEDTAGEACSITVGRGRRGGRCPLRPLASCRSAASQFSRDPLGER